MTVKRQVNFELLRIVAIGMIIMVHYMGRGGILLPYGEDGSALNHAAWFIESFCVESLNCYVLISGYFFIDSVWKPKRILSLVAQVLFYSVLIPVAMICIGMLSISELSIYDWMTFVLPFQTEHYWFATHYLILYLFAPILAAGVQVMEKRTQQIVIFFLLLFFSIGKTVIPFNLVTDTDGYHYGWLLCLFLVAAYIRKFGFPWLEKGKRSLVLYIGMCILIWVVSAASGMIERRTGALSHYVEMPYTLNYFLVFIASLALFFLFRNLQINEGMAAFLIRKAEPHTFGVYLLHCHILVQGKWMYWLGLEKVQRTWLFIPHMIICVLIIYIVGTVVDFVRAYLFAWVGRLIDAHKKIPDKKSDRK